MLDVSRRELKYLVSLEETHRLKNKLSQIMKMDMHNGENGYRVRSLYFDTLRDSDFEEKVDGYDSRKKIRLRVYDLDSGVAKLELKEKTGFAQRKRSLLLDRKEAEAMMNGRYSFLLQREEPLAHSLYTFILTRGYSPKCIVEYDRLAYWEDVNDIRITFDMNLRATEAKLNGLFDKNLILYPVSPKSEVTMEVKYNGFIYTYLKNIISISDRMQVSNSKYIRARMVSKKGRK